MVPGAVEGWDWGHSSLLVVWALWGVRKTAGRGEKRDLSIIATEQLYLSLGLSWDQLQGCASRNVSPLSLGSGFVSWKEMQEV